MEFKDKKIGILGFGIEGRATAEYLLKKGVKSLTVLDAKEDLKVSLESLGYDFRLGDDYLKNLKDFDIIFITPGIKPTTKEITEAKAQGVIFESQIGYFIRECPGRIIGVTGTKGKGTTATLIKEILKVGGKNVYLGGNIGVPAIEFLDELIPEDYIVLELSSFQLQYLDKSPHISVVLMITSEHLDYHPSQEDYVESKKNIVRFQKEDDFSVINFDYDLSQSFSNETKAKVFFISRKEEVMGSFLRENKIFINIGEGDIEVAAATEVSLRGQHNLENIAAASLAAYLAGSDIENIRETVRSFKGLEYRLEYLGEIDERKYYNDSFSTVPEATMAALDSFEEDIVLIAGGSNKGSNYEELGKKIAKKAKVAILIGDTAQEIEQDIRKHGDKVKIIKGLTKMSEMVETAKEESKKGDVILLSPGCASFGLFKNYKDRGEQFKKEVIGR